MRWQGTPAAWDSARLPPPAEKDAVELYAGADSPVPDAGALIYAAHRLPRCMWQVRRVLLGQLPEQFAAVLGQPITHWQPVEAAARRRQWRYDGRGTLAVHIASSSDVDDVVPTLVAYHIEWNKLHDLARENAEVRELLAQPEPPDAAGLATLGAALQFPADDWARLQAALGDDLWPTLRAMAAAENDISVNLLGGRHVSYAKLFDRWWEPIQQMLAAHDLAGRPVYFVSPMRSTWPRLGPTRARVSAE
jgi:hypothetical protein